MTENINRQIRLAGRPIGLPKDSDWELAEEVMPTPEPGQVVVRNRFLSVDPAMRGWMNDRKSYVLPLPLGSVMRALTVGEVVASKNASFVAGDSVAGLGGIQTFSLGDGTDLQKIDLSLAPFPVWLDTLGIAGLTAYCGLLEVGEPRTGETVLVSGAAGSVGAHVGQIAKIKGCHAVGIAGGEKKCSYLTDELGFDNAIDYQKETLSAGLKRTCPDGVDIYFDNVGGDTLNAALTRINVGARVVICGAISQYNATELAPGPSAYINLLGRRGRMQGFIYFDYRERWPEMQKDLAEWKTVGKIKTKHDIAKGDVDIFPETLLRLFRGANFGKLMIQLPEQRIET